MTTSDATHMEHMAKANALLDPADATHVAVRNGAWSNPATWAGGNVPGQDANVHIPEGISILYDVRASANLGTIRVDGTLSFTRAHNTEMRVETIVTTMGSRFDAGSMADPIPPGVEIDIIFRDTPIDLAADPDMLGHGLVAFGEVDIQGAAKESFLVIKHDVPAGATSMAVEGDLTNWKAGDTILIVGTKYLGEDENDVLMTQDETRTITRVDGDRIYFDAPLDHAHERPTSMEADIYVGNLSRNVTFRSENPEGTRGHVMLHNSTPNAADGSINDVRYAAFEDLGRTDKSIDTSATNPEGRYPLHLHMIGTGVDAPTNMLIGNAVTGSPGWGIVQHQSRALVNDNVVYDIMGAGIVSEWGNETGAWMRNLVSSVTGADVPSKSSNGDQGAAYENQSRIIVQQDNIAANSKLGWNFSGQEAFPEDDPDKAPVDGIHRKMFEREQLKFDPDPFDVAIDHEEGVITDFVGNVVMTSTEAFRAFHRQFAHHSDTLSVIRDFDIWGGHHGVALENYAYNYEFIDSDWSGTGIAFTMWQKNSSAVLNDIRVSDFGLLWRSYGISHEAVLYDVQTTNVGEMFDVKYDSSKGDTAYWIDYFAQFGIDYLNPLPKVLSASDVNPDAGLTFELGADADVTLAPGDNRVHVTGTITDGLGTRVFYEHIVSSIVNQGGSYNGARLDLYTDKWHRNFLRDEFLAEHGTWQKANGDWVAPVVFWLTERFHGEQHPVVIEIRLEGFDDTYLSQFALDAYPSLSIDNAEFDHGFDIAGTEPGDDPVQPPDAILRGGPTDDALTGSAANDRMLGEAGDDSLTGNGGADSLLGGPGSDVLVAESRGLFHIDVSAQVYRLYDTVFGREPDGGGHHAWAHRLLGGTTLEQAATAFVASPEFVATYGATNDTQFVTFLYQNVLNRLPSTEDREFWVGRLDGNWSRTDVVLFFSESAEHVRKTSQAQALFDATSDITSWGDDVYRLYRALFDRDPDAGGFDTWTTRLASGWMTLPEVIESFMSLQEFQTTYGGATSNTDFVTLLYLNVLKRQPDPDGLNGWVTSLNDGMTREQVVLAFMSAPEFVTNTRDDMVNWMRTRFPDDVLEPGAGDAIVSGGAYADTFVFTNDGQVSEVTVTDVEAWDRLDFSGFGMTQAQVLGAMAQDGANVVFTAGNETIVFASTQLGEITQDMILV